MQLRDQIQTLQAQLAQRPPIEAIQELRKEYSNLELILQGTQRENERAMTELERLVSPAIVWKMVANSSCCARSTGADKERSFWSASSKNLQGVIGRCAVPSTTTLSREAHDPCALSPLYPILMQANLEITSAGITSPLPSRTTTGLFSPSMQHVTSPTPGDGNQNSKANVEATMAHVEQVRLLVLGMEERLRTREEKLAKTVEKADQESHRFEVLSKDALRAKS